jgi:hypothetical protein
MCEIWHDSMSVAAILAMLQNLYYERVRFPCGSASLIFPVCPDPQQMVAGGGVCSAVKAHCQGCVKRQASRQGCISRP